MNPGDTIVISNSKWSDGAYTITSSRPLTEDEIIAHGGNIPIDTRALWAEVQKETAG